MKTCKLNENMFKYNEISLGIDVSWWRFAAVGNDSCDLRLESEQTWPGDHGAPMPNFTPQQALATLAVHAR